MKLEGLQEALNEISKALPKHSEHCIGIYIENGAAWVCVEQNDGTSWHIDSDGDIAEQVQVAVREVWANEDPAQYQLEEFNEKHPIGTTVFVRRNGKYIETKTRTLAQKTVNDDTVIFLEGIPGYVDINTILVD